MKKIFSAICVLLAMTAVSCQKEDSAAESKANVTIKSSSLVIDAAGENQGRIVFSSDSRINVEIEKSWCTYEIEKDTIFLNASQNASILSRYSKITISAGKTKINLTAQQMGYQSVDFAPADIVVSADGDTKVLPYSYNSTIDARCDADWVTLDISSEALTVTIAPDETLATISDMSRTASISWSLGMDSGVIKVTQMHKDFMQQDPNWTVKYLGRTTYQGDPADEISNTVAEPGISGKYMIYYFEKAEVTASGLTLANYISSQLEELKALLDETIAYYSQFGYELTYSDFLYEDSDYEVFDPMDDGTYYGLAIGFDDDMNGTGHYNFCEFNVKNGGGDTSGYDSWLGDWTVPHGSSTDVWTISKKVDGSTYSISGVESLKNFPPIEAEYDATTGELVVYAQLEIGQVETQSYGTATVNYLGLNGTSLLTGNYVIFTAKRNGNTATLTPSTVSTSSGDVTFNAAGYVGKTESGQYLVFSNDRTPLPNTISTEGGSGDNPSDAYSKWLGSWDVDGGEFTVTISKRVANQSYDVTGWQIGEESFFDPMYAEFDEESGAILFCGDFGTPFATGVTLQDDDAVYDFYYVGKFIYDDGKEYFIGNEEPYEVGYAMFNADGSATIKGCDFELSSGGEYTYTRLEVLISDQDDPDGLYTLNSKPNEFPLSMARAKGSSSVKSSSYDKKCYSNDYKVEYCPASFRTAGNAVKTYGTLSVEQAITKRKLIIK